MGKIIINKLFTTSTTFKVTAAMDKVVLMAFGGGGNGAARHSGGGGGCAVMILDEPTPGMEYVLTIGGVGGNTQISYNQAILNSSGSSNVVIAYGGENATASAHGAGGAAIGGDINSTGGTGDTTAGGGAGSPFGDSEPGGDMFLIEEYALAYEQMLKHNLLNTGYTWPQTPPNPWTGSYYNTESATWIPAFRGNDGGEAGSRRAGFLGKGNSSTSNNNQITFYPAGFGSSASMFPASSNIGIAGGFGRHSTAHRTTAANISGLKSTFGGGGGYNNNTGTGYHNGGDGGYGGGGGGFAATGASPGTGGSGAVLALIEVDDMLCIPYL